ncbi:hypothetical protein C0Q70_18209 [Pomacea canaliculata]|uniref:Uncharacterized protein n=1 Tax=Pomacea canaliculata TaxID=400727 RepID=A0A2T7NMK6_POMCA|nr:hypothetical protein C0Q70_18209 [Pomacea canaliculata]
MAIPRGMWGKAGQELGRDVRARAGWSTPSARKSDTRVKGITRVSLWEQHSLPQANETNRMMQKHCECKTPGFVHVIAVTTRLHYDVVFRNSHPAAEFSLPSHQSSAWTGGFGPRAIYEDAHSASLIARVLASDRQEPRGYKAESGIPYVGEKHGGSGGRLQLLRKQQVDALTSLVFPRAAGRVAIGEECEGKSEEHTRTYSQQREESCSRPYNGTAYPGQEMSATRYRKVTVPCRYVADTAVGANNCHTVVYGKEDANLPSSQHPK